MLNYFLYILVIIVIGISLLIIKRKFRAMNTIIELQHEYSKSNTMLIDTLRQRMGNIFDGYEHNYKSIQELKQQASNAFEAFNQLETRVKKLEKTN